jgi:hypothetical protein
VARSLASLAWACAAQGKKEEAREAHRRVFAILDALPSVPRDLREIVRDFESFLASSSYNPTAMGGSPS